MANPARGGSFVVVLAVVAAAVVLMLVITFVVTGEDVPEQATVTAEDAESRPAGAGTLPEGEADETLEGVTDRLDEVDPAAPGPGNVRPAGIAGTGQDPQTEGEVDADEKIAGTADEPAADAEPEATGDAAETVESDPAETGAARDTATEENSFLMDDDSDATDGQVDQPGRGEAEAFPEGRDTQTDLTTEPGQDVVEDTDTGGTAFVPTPSGPEGRDDEVITGDEEIIGK